MSLLILVVLAVLLGVLALSAVSGLARPAIPSQRRPTFVPLPAVGAILSLLALLDGRSAALPVPVGFAGGSGGIQLDLLSALFLLLAFLAAWFVEAALPLSSRQRSLLRLCLSALTLTMLAADAFLLAIGGILAILAVGQAGGGASAGRMKLIACTGLLGACVLLASRASPPDALLTDAGFSLLRAHGGGRPDPAGGMLLPLLTLAITLPLLGIWPCQGWHRRLHVAAPVWAPVLATLLGLFLLLRLLLDLAGPAGSPPCGLVLILLGLAGAVQAGAAALFGTRLRPAIGRLLSVSSGLSLAGIGICYLARAEDLPVLAGTALDAVLLLMPAQVLAGLGALVLGQAMETEAGASTLRRLGGLAQSMPRASLLAGVAVLLLGFLPPAGVFAGLWLLLQATLTASRLGGGWLSGLMPVGIVVVMVLSAGLCLTGWLRLASVGILGRPRTPRGAAALDIQPLLVRALCCLFALPGLIGLFPGLWLHAMAPLRQLLDPGVDGADFSVFRLVSPGNTAGLSPLPLVLLATLVLGVAGRARRRLLPVGAVRHAPAWEGGAPPPPPWLPFGDPAAQIGPATLPRALVAALGGDAWPDWMTKPATAPTRRRLRRSIGATRAASLRLSLMLRSHAGLPVLVLLASVLAVAGWWQAP